MAPATLIGFAPATKPAARVTRHDGRDARTYVINDREYLSVTTYLKGIPKPALTHWAGQVERQYVVAVANEFYGDVAKSGTLLPPSAFGLSLTLRLGDKLAQYMARDTAGNIGTEAHQLIEWQLRKELGQPVDAEPQVSDEAAIAVMGWEDWRKSVDLEPLSVEDVVYHPEDDYAGTIDLLARVNGRVTLVDFKTGKAVYGEARVQSAAYRWALQRMGLTPTLADGIVIRLPKTLDEPEFEAVAIEDDVEGLLATFRAAQTIYRWQAEQPRAPRKARAKRGPVTMALATAAPPRPAPAPAVASAILNGDDAPF